MKYSSEDLERLIPQRKPFMMVDTFEPTGDNSATTALCLGHDNYFVIPGGEMAESGMIEHMAQSVSALSGYKALLAATEASGAETGPPVGIIGEVKHFECLRRPKVSERIVTSVELGLSFGNVTMAKCESTVDGATVGRISLKVFMQ